MKSNPPNPQRGKTMQEEEIKEKIKNLWGDALKDGLVAFGGNYQKAQQEEDNIAEAIVAIFSQQQQKERQGLVKELEKMKKETIKGGVRMEINFGHTTLGDIDEMVTNGENTGYNYALDDAIEVLKGKEDTIHTIGEHGAVGFVTQGKTICAECKKPIEEL